tara:strand:+ start:1046 stop:1246 length:201 start_codon:yes stop_codon:yes gene_type:complete
MKVGDLVQGWSFLDGSDRIGIIVEIINHVGVSTSAKKYRVVWLDDHSTWWYDRESFEPLEKNKIFI